MAYLVRDTGLMVTEELRDVVHQDPHTPGLNHKHHTQEGQQLGDHQDPGPPGGWGGGEESIMHHCPVKLQLNNRWFGLEQVNSCCAQQMER
jgi:hypothetical protein